MDATEGVPPGCDTTFLELDLLAPDPQQAKLTSLKLFGELRGTPGMNTFLKILLLVVVAILAVKMLPLTLALGFMLGLALVVMLVLGLSAVTILLGLGVLFGALLSPIWLPILALVGAVALARRLSRNAA